MLRSMNMTTVVLDIRGDIEPLGSMQADLFTVSSDPFFHIDWKRVLLKLGATGSCSGQLAEEAAFTVSH